METSDSENEDVCVVQLSREYRRVKKSSDKKKKKEKHHRDEARPKHENDAETQERPSKIKHEKYEYDDNENSQERYYGVVEPMEEEVHKLGDIVKIYQTPHAAASSHVKKEEVVKQENDAKKEVKSETETPSHVKKEDVVVKEEHNAKKEHA